MRKRHTDKNKKTTLANKKHAATHMDTHIYKNYMSLSLYIYIYVCTHIEIYQKHIYWEDEEKIPSMQGKDFQEGKSRSLHRATSPVSVCTST